MEQKPIHEFAVDDQIEGFYAVRTRQVREYYKGKFVSLELGDSSGRVPGVIWEPDQFALADLAEGMVVKVRGTVTEYRGKTQLQVARLREATPEEYDLTLILPQSKQSYDVRKQRLLDLRGRIENPHILKLTNAFLEDEEFFDRFLMAAAGKLWHHATVGGLAEHSANVGELALRIAEGYDFLRKDYLAFGGIFHDVGKIDTYHTNTVIDYTDEGRLIGHICLADHWIAERAAAIDGFPPQLLVELRHLILAHQGELAYATPVVPQIPEAFVLYYCDEIDSKMGAIERIRKRHDGQGWSEYVKVLSRFLYFGQPEERDK